MLCWFDGMRRTFFRFRQPEILFYVEIVINSEDQNQKVIMELMSIHK